MIFIILFLVLILAALAVISIVFIKKSLVPETDGYEENFKKEIERGSIDEKYYNALTKEDFYTDSEYGYPLHGIWFPNGESKETVVIVHGYTANLFTSMRYIRLFFEKGYNVLIYDHRFHGKSGGDYCSMGYFEKYDLRTMVGWVIKKTGPLSVVGVHGESMGAATAVLHAAIDDRIAFTIADCPYDDLRRQFAYSLKVKYKLPSFPIMYTGSLAAKIMFKFFFKDVSPIGSIPHIKTPVMFIHGDSDRYVPTSCSVNMYHSMRARKGLFLAKGAKHAESIFADREDYTKVVYRFIDSLKKVEV